MRILIFNWRDIKNPRAGGSELFFHEISKQLVKRGHKVTWIVGGWKNCKEEEFIDGIKIKRVGGELSLYSLAPLAYFKIKSDIDVIIDVDNGLPFFTPLFALNKKRFYHVHHVHKEIWKKEAEGKGIKEKLIALIGYSIERFIVPLVYSNEKVITISKSSADEIKYLKIGKRISGIVSPGIQRSLKEKKWAKSKRPTILFLNRIKRYKGIQIFLDAIKILEKQKIKPEVWVCGGGDDLEKMKEYSKEQALEGVTFFGRISEEKKIELMDKAWIFVNPSFKEGWGIVNIEANDCGVPVVGSNVGGIKDSVVDGKTGLLFNYGDSKDLAEKLKVLLENKSLREKFGNEARKWSKQFTWEKSADKFLEIIETK
ncbi:Trehalose synthase [uncultured archaeon]|nr:Trehalose synthase [uncultured archaeon]